MQTQEQQEQEHGFYIISTMEVTKDKDTEKLSKQPVVTHLSYKIVIPGKETILKGFYPKKDEDTKNSINTLKSLIVKSEGEYVDDTKRLELAREWDALYPDDPASHIKKIPFTDEEVLKAYDVAEERLKNPGTYHLQSSNCVHEVQEVYQGSGRRGSFTDEYTSEELAQKMPGLTMSGIGRAFMAGSFFPGDKPLTVLGTSVQEVAKKYDVDESRVSQREEITGVPYDLAIEQEAANQFTYVIGPNPLLVASAASEEEQKISIAKNTQSAETNDDENIGLLEVNEVINKKLQNAVITSDTPYSQYMLDKIEDSQRQIQEMQGKLQGIGYLMHKNMRQCVNEWLKEQQKPEVKLARFGFTKEDMINNPEKFKYLSDNYDEFSLFYNCFEQRFGIKSKFDDLPDDIAKLELVLEHSDAISEFIEEELISSIQDLTDNTELLQTLLENEMAVLHLKNLNVINSLSEVESRITDLTILPDFIATTNKAIEILESQNMLEDAKKAKLARELYSMTEAQQESEKLIMEELNNRGQLELIDFCKHQFDLESAILGDTDTSTEI
jgi:hypothetical protein